jgi:predicted acetyltransferase
MKDLRKTGIEGIERHWHNYKLLVWFLRIKGKYVFFKRMIFTNKNIMPYDLFELMNSANENNMIFNFFNVRNIPNVIDKKWGSIFGYAPFSFYWCDSDVNPIYMVRLSKEWVNFLREHNYDKQKEI